MAVAVVFAGWRYSWSLLVAVNVDIVELQRPSIERPGSHALPFGRITSMFYAGYYVGRRHPVLDLHCGERHPRRAAESSALAVHSAAKRVMSVKRAFGVAKTAAGEVGVHGAPQSMARQLQNMIGLLWPFAAEKAERRSAARLFSAVFIGKQLPVQAGVGVRRPRFARRRIVAERTMGNRTFCGARRQCLIRRHSCFRKGNGSLQGVGRTPCIRHPAATFQVIPHGPRITCSPEPIEAFCPPLLAIVVLVVSLVIDVVSGITSTELLAFCSVMALPVRVYRSLSEVELGVHMPAPHLVPSWGCTYGREYRHTGSRYIFFLSLPPFGCTKRLIRNSAAVNFTLFWLSGYSLPSTLTGFRGAISSFDEVIVISEVVLASRTRRQRLCGLFHGKAGHLLSSNTTREFAAVAGVFVGYIIRVNPLHFPVGIHV